MESVITHNQKAWDQQVKNQSPWSKPVDAATIAKAKQGEWQVHLMPTPVDKSWFASITGKKILCLAAAGGQQAPVLAAAGADVTVFDLSEGQLQQDALVAERDGLTLKTVQGDMQDLSIFIDEPFDLVFHPISNLYVPDVRKVWQECHRVLKPQGRLLASFYNPVVFIGDRSPELAEEGLIKPLYKVPFSEINDLPTEVVNQKITEGSAFVYGHSLTDLIAGQIAAGFVIAGFAEDYQPQPRFVIDHYLPTFLSTCAIKTGC